jgi:hypothetical protein
MEATRFQMRTKDRVDQHWNLHSLTKSLVFNGNTYLNHVMQATDVMTQIAIIGCNPRDTLKHRKQPSDNCKEHTRPNKAVAC